MLVNGILITRCSLIPVGHQALFRDGNVVYVGLLSDPIEDAEFDGVMLNPADYDRLSEKVSSGS